MPRRVDANQKSVVKRLRDGGASVLVMSDLGKGAPDIAVGLNGKTYLFELKDGNKPPSAQKLTESEQKFHDEWRGHLGIIRSFEDVDRFLQS